MPDIVIHIQNRTVLASMSRPTVSVDLHGTGARGPRGYAALFGFSVDGLVWSDDPGAGTVYMRVSNDNGDTWRMFRVLGLPGDDGLTPHIGLNGNWFIGEDDTGVKAQGDDGDPGADGSTVLGGSGTPSPELGADGDFYIDTTPGAVAIHGPKTAGAWGSPTSLKGDPGDDATVVLSDDGPADLAEEADPGDSDEVSRADHVHKLPADIAANSAARHTQGTDQGLDTGGPNAVTAAQAKGAHTHAGITSGNPHGTTASDVGAIPTTQKGAANGVAPLGADAKIASAYLPAIAIVDVFAVADETEQLALAAQQGDVAVRADQSKSYIHNGGIAGTMDDWTLLKTPADAVLSVAGQTGAISKTDLLSALNVEDGAQKNVQSDWNALTGDAFILNKPTLGTAAALDVPATGNAASGEAVKGDDTRLSDARTPTAHASTHATGQPDAITPYSIGAEAEQTAATDEEIIAGDLTAVRKVSPAQLRLAAETFGGAGDIDGGSPSAVYSDDDDIDGGTP